MSERPLSVISSAILSVFFLLILVLPLAENLLHFTAEMELPENRKRQEYPKLDLTAQGLLTYPTRFEAAFNDNFGFRALLVQWQAFAKYFWLDLSPSQQVLVGVKDGFTIRVRSTNTGASNACRRQKPGLGCKSFRLNKPFVTRAEFGI